MNDCWLLTGDCREMLGCVKEKSVHCCVTSPPYWGLRDYGLDPVIWDDGWIGCLGMEKSPDQFVSHLVEVFRSVWRVLRDDGTLWLNLGDSYARDRRKGQHKPGQSGRMNAGTYDMGAGRASACLDLPAKSLIGIPWRVAIALQDDGWILRNECIWHKRNCLPESVRDRFTRCHEHMFMFAKQERYHFDIEAAKEPVTDPGRSSGNVKRKLDVAGERDRVGTHVGSSVPYEDTTGKRNPRTVWDIPVKVTKGNHFAYFPPALVEKCLLPAISAGGCCFACGTPTVRVIERGEPDAAWQSKCGADSKGGYQGKATKDFASAKAQDASAVKARILAGMVEKKTVGYKAACKCYDQFYRDLPQARSERQRLQREITGDWWKRASRRPLDPSWPTRPAVALDPFAGSGTVGLVARQHKCRSILIEQSEEYGQLIRDRLGLE